MNAAVAPTADLTKLNLSELQRLYAEAIGEQTKCPNKKYLIRRITEAVGSEPDRVEAEEARAGEPAGKELADSHASEERRNLTKLDVDDLRARYLEGVGRPTTSSHRGYIIWKIRQAQRGKVPIGPIKRAANAERKVIPLRLETELVERLDDLRRQRGMRSRTEFFRQAIRCYLEQLGEEALAAEVASAGREDSAPTT